jgi:hypothetical protein
MFAVPPPVFASGFCQVSGLRGGGLRVGVESGGKTVRALRECPHLRIEIWGTRFCGSNLDVGHPPRWFLSGWSSWNSFWWDHGMLLC